jgi:hypothetical protein
MTSYAPATASPSVTRMSACRPHGTRPQFLSARSNPCLPIACTGSWIHGTAMRRHLAPRGQSELPRELWYPHAETRGGPQIYLFAGPLAESRPSI